MKRHFKSIATAVLVVVMLVSSYVPAMAAEQVRDESVVNVEHADTRASTMVASYYYDGAITKDKTLSPINIERGRARTVRWNVAGSGGNVIFRMVNRTTGDTRSFTTIGDGQWSSLTYVSSMDTGVWDIQAIFVSGSGHNNVKLEFYS